MEELRFLVVGVLYNWIMNICADAVGDGGVRYHWDGASQLLAFLLRREEVRQCETSDVPSRDCSVSSCQICANAPKATWVANVQSPPQRLEQEIYIRLCVG